MSTAAPYTLCASKHALHYTLCTFLSYTAYSMHGKQYAVYSMQGTECSMRHAVWRIEYTVDTMQCTLQMIYRAKIEIA